MAWNPGLSNTNYKLCCISWKTSEKGEKETFGLGPTVYTFGPDTNIYEDHVKSI